MGQIDARNLDICKDPFFQPDPCSGIRRYQMKRRPFLVLAIVLVVVSAFAQPKVNANKILKGDKLGQQLVTAVEKENNSNTSELLAKQPTILSRTIALEIALNRNFTNTSNLILASGIAKDKDPDGMTALMYASKHGLTSAIRELVRNGATIDQRMSVREYTNLRESLGLSPGVRQTVKALLTVRWNCIVPRKPFLARWAPDGEAAAGSAGAQPAKE
jgi:hypothetical protein